MSKPAVRFLSDLALWAICLITIGVLRGLGVIENMAMAVAGGALWMAIRAQSKADVNSAQTSNEEA